MRTFDQFLADVGRCETLVRENHGGVTQAMLNRDYSKAFSKVPEPVVRGNQEIHTCPQPSCQKQLVLPNWVVKSADNVVYCQYCGNGWRPLWLFPNYKSQKAQPS